MDRNKTSVGGMAMRRTTAMGIITLSAVGALTAQVPAAVAAARQPEAELKLETIIVTATKRHERDLDVPISLTVFDADSLVQMGAVDAESYVRNVPGLTYNPSATGRPTYSLRGVSTSNQAANTQATVAIYLDDLPALSSYAAPVVPDLRLFDVERVEVLRGPQGTLFGSGAMGGAIRVLTRKPDLSDTYGRIELGGTVTQSGEDGYSVNGMINVPLGSKVAARAVVYQALDGGYVDNTARNASDVNTSRAKGGRLSVQADLTPSFVVTGTVLTQHNEYDDIGTVLAPPQQLEFDSRVPSSQSSRLTMYNLAAEYRMRVVSLFSSTSYAEEHADSRVDLTDGFAPLLGLFGMQDPVVPFDSTADLSFFSQELRLASSDDTSFKWLVGAFFLKRETDDPWDFIISSAGAGAVFAPFGFPSDRLYHGRVQVPGKEQALFGEFSWAFAPQWTLTAGLRAFRNESTYAESTDGFLNGGPTQSSQTTSESARTPKFALTWQPSQRLSLYTQAAKGYRVGQNNPVIPPDPVTGARRGGPYGPDSLWNYELGVKSIGWSDRLRVNASVYYIDWKDIQIDQVTEDRFTYIANAGKARSQGGELELVLTPTPSIQLASALSRTNAVLESDAEALGGKIGRSPAGIGSIPGQYIGAARIFRGRADERVGAHRASVSWQAGLRLRLVGRQCGIRRIQRRQPAAHGDARCVGSNRVRQQHRRQPRRCLGVRSQHRHSDPPAYHRIVSARGFLAYGRG